ncbi:unnamed protein product [Durusdinium trenchii]|uniref:Uncharacterized protein n=1 Tax=Durusdinium trenchii TaxID=1381693 RepID=A0ABP0I470_9DINO
MEVWLPGTYRIQLLQRRKICIFGLIRVMHLPMPPKVLEACCQALLRLLRLRQAGHPVLIFEELFNNRPLFLCKRSEGINPGDEFQVAYNHLDQAELKEDVWDVLPEIQDVPTAKVAVKQALAQLGEANLLEVREKNARALMRGRLRERRQQRLKMSFFNQTTALLESVVQTWFQVARDHRITRRRQEMLRDKKLREVTRILLTGMLHGAELFCILEAWHQMVQERRSGEEKKLKAQKVISQLASDQLGMAFTGWCAACKAQRAAEAQRFQAVQKTVLVGLQATVGVVWAAWAKGLAKRKRKQQLLQHLSASSEQSLQLAFGAWWRHCNVSKARHSRRSSAAERAVLKSLRGILSESFTEWKDLTRSERLHVLGGQLARAKGNVKALSALKLKTVLQQESGCMCRILMCWQLWTSEQLAIQKERRRLARTAGLGRSSAIRLQCRLTQQRVMLAWLMMSKLRPTAEKPGTFIVKSLPEPQARLALPSPVQVVTSVEAIDEPPQAVTFEVERSPKDSPESAAAAAAAAAWLQASEAPSPSRFRVTTSPTRASERYTLASKAATNDGDYRQLLEHHRREIREQREAARRSSPERVQQWGVWAK